MLATGGFTSAGGIPSTGLAEWKSSQWVIAGNGLPATMSASVELDEDGAGPGSAALYAGGSFTLLTPTGPAANVAKWNGSSWAPVGAGLPGPVHALGAFDEDGPGPLPPALFAAGEFPNPPGLAPVAKWNGASWTLLPHWLFPLSTGRALVVFDEDGSAWSPLGAGLWGSSLGPIPTPAALTLTSFAEPGAAAPALYAGGSFQTAGGVGSSRIARWAGDSALVLGYAWTSSGDLAVSDASCLPGASCFNAFSFDPLNATSPALGWWSGLFIDVGSLVTQFSVGAPPFVVTLDSAGAASSVVPAPLIAPLAGQTVWGVAHTYDPVLLAPLVHSSVASWQL